MLVFGERNERDFSERVMHKHVSIMFRSTDLEVLLKEVFDICGKLSSRFTLDSKVWRTPIVVVQGYETFVS